VGKYVGNIEFLGTSEEQSIFILGALVPNSEKPSFHFSIFTRNKSGSVNATQVDEWTSSKLLANTPDKSELTKVIGETENDIKLKIGERDIVESQLDPLKEEISKVGMVDDINNIQLQLAAMEDLIQSSQQLSNELDELLERGRSLVDPSDIDQTRKTMSEHLTEAAKITSVADRLNRRREEAALQNFKRKLTAVKEMKQVNMEDLAKEVLRLRRIRRKLESQLNLNPTDFDNDQF
jgi:hypothetical protein